VLADLARELRVTLGDLLGEPVLAEDDEEDDDVPAVRDVLMAPRRLSRILYRADRSENAAPPVAWAQRYVEAVWRDYQAGRVGRVIGALPELITMAQHLEDLPGEGEQRRQSWAVSARTHHLAATTLSKVGEADLGWIAAERAMRAADQSDDPLVLASAARACTHALLATGRYDDALDLGLTAAGWLHDQVAGGDPEALSLFGMLNLRTAVAAARDHDRRTATVAGTARSITRAGKQRSHGQRASVRTQARAANASRMRRCQPGTGLRAGPRPASTPRTRAGPLTRSRSNPIKIKPRNILDPGHL
jgi:hypothetical protein